MLWTRAVSGVSTWNLLPGVRVCPISVREGRVPRDSRTTLPALESELSVESELLGVSAFEQQEQWDGHTQSRSSSFFRKELMCVGVCRWVRPAMFREGPLVRTFSPPEPDAVPWWHCPGRRLRASSSLSWGAASRTAENCRRSSPWFRTWFTAPPSRPPLVRGADPRPSLGGAGGAARPSSGQEGPF